MALATPHRPSLLLGGGRQSLVVEVGGRAHHVERG
jgi:hypothetical protein